MAATELHATFDAVEPYTIGLEEELMLLDPETGDLRHDARAALAELADDETFKLEMPASQLEIVTRPARSVPAAIAQLASARRRLAAALDGSVRPAVAGAHPFTAPEGRVNPGSRYKRVAHEYGTVARRQLVCALQIHVAVGGADRTLAVYNALRSHLPELAALAANAPFHAGADTGLASVRPQLCGMLPRQGIPPPIESWEAHAADLAWGRATGAMPDDSTWWWELRPHPRYGTLELRVPDAQTTVAEAAAVAATGHALVVWLAERHDAGDLRPPDPTWRIAENRWSAYGHGMLGTLADLRTGRPIPTAARIERLLDALVPVAQRLGCAGELERAHYLAARNGAERQRQIARDRGLRGLADWLAERYLAGTAIDVLPQPAPLPPQPVVRVA
jgi:carboxylate-amine ligase